MKAKKKTIEKSSPVDESVQVCRAREKLKKRMEALEKKMTTQALEKKTLEIHQWIAKNSSDRLVISTKNSSLFDENQNPAKGSRRVSAVAEKIQKEIELLHDLLKIAREKVVE